MVGNRQSKLKYTWVGKEGKEPEKKPFVSFPTYYYFWKKNYPHLKVKSQAEDTCSFFWQFANCHKYALNTAALLCLAQDPTIGEFCGECQRTVHHKAAMQSGKFSSVGVREGIEEKEYTNNDEENEVDQSEKVHKMQMKMRSQAKRPLCHVMTRSWKNRVVVEL